MDKAQLQEYRGLVLEIERLKLEREEILAKAENPPKPDGLPHGQGGTSDPTGTVAIKLAAIALIIDDLIAQAVEERQAIEAAISILPAADRCLIRLRYIDGLSWPRVTEKIYGKRTDFIDRFDGYLRRVFRQHGRILQKIK